MTGTLARSPAVEPHTLGVPLGVEEVAVEMCSSDEEFGDHDGRSLVSGDHGKGPGYALARQELPTPPAICDPTKPAAVVREVLDAASMKLRRSLTAGLGTCGSESFRGRGADLCRLLPRRSHRALARRLLGMPSPVTSRPLDTKVDPQIMRVSCPNGQTDCAGEYALVPNHRPSGQPLWKHRENERWLFHTPEGKWSIGGPKEQGEDFACCTGYLYRNSDEPEGLPHQGTGTWERWDGVRWLTDIDVHVAAVHEPVPQDGGAGGRRSRSVEAPSVTVQQQPVLVPSPPSLGPPTPQLSRDCQGAVCSRAGGSRAGSPSPGRHPRFTASDLREGLCQLRQRVARLGETCASLEALTAEYGNCGSSSVVKMAIAEEHTRLMSEVKPQLSDPEKECDEGAAEDEAAAKPAAADEAGDGSLAVLRQYVASLTSGKGAGADGGLGVLDQLMSSMMGTAPARPPLMENSPRNLQGRECSRGLAGVPPAMPTAPTAGLGAPPSQLVLPAIQPLQMNPVGLQMASLQVPPPMLPPEQQLGMPSVGLAPPPVLLPALPPHGLQAPAGLQVNLFQASPLCTPRGFSFAHSFESPSPMALASRELSVQ